MRVPIESDGTVNCPMFKKIADGNECVKCVCFEGRSYNDYVHCSYQPDKKKTCPKCGGTGKIVDFPGDKERRRKNG